MVSLRDLCSAARRLDTRTRSWAATVDASRADDTPLCEREESYMAWSSSTTAVTAQAEDAGRRQWLLGNPAKMSCNPDLQVLSHGQTSQSYAETGRAERSGRSVGRTHSLAG